MKKITLYFLLATNIALTGLLSATENPAMSQMAEDAYNNGDYVSAKNIYQRMLTTTSNAGTLHYNIGNCYFRLKDYPSAILHYEKALKNNPGDADIKHNLYVANTYIKDDITPLPEFFLKKWWKTVINITSSSGWTLLHIVAFIVFLIMLTLFLIIRRYKQKKKAFSGSIIFSVLTVLLLVLAHIRRNFETRTNEAIIFSSSVTVKSAPGASSTNLTELHAGTKVTITNHVDEWVEIRTADGNVGWVPRLDLETI